MTGVNKSRLIGTALLGIGLALLAAPLYHLAARTLAVGGYHGHGDAAGWLAIPAADVDTPIIDSDDGRDLNRLPILGFRKGGLNMVMAHRDMHFRGLGKVEFGDEIAIRLPGEPEKRLYQVVDREILEPDAVRGRLEGKTNGDWLVVMTCHPFRHIGPAPQRYLLWCRPAVEIR